MITTNSIHEKIIIQTNTKENNYDEILENPVFIQLLKEHSEAMTKMLVSRYETYKHDITSRFSDFTDSVFEAELLPVITAFKMILKEYDEDKKEMITLLEEAKEEIISLRNQLDKK